MTQNNNQKQLKSGLDMYLRSKSKNQAQPRLVEVKKKKKKRNNRQKRKSKVVPFNNPISRAFSDGEAWSGRTKRVHRMILGLEDKFHAALLANLFDASKPFPLPSPGATPFNSFTGVLGGLINEALGTQTGSVDSGNKWNSTEAHGTTTPQYTGGGAMIGRYSRYSGRAIATVETTTDANGRAEIWFCHDPFNVEFPLVVFKPSVSGDYTGMTRLVNAGWTSNPYPLATSYVDEGGSGPGLKVEQRNIYYEGGSMLHVHTLNKNAYLSVSYQTRTGNNSYDRFIDTLPSLWTTADPGSALNLSDTPEEADGCISMYTGTTWSKGVSFKSQGDEPGSQFQVSEYFRRTWALGAPWVRALVRTTNAGVAATGSVQFSINLLSWVATAPSDPALASSMPLETVPVVFPTWGRAMRTRGQNYKGKTDPVSAIWSRQINKIPSTMIPTTPMTRAILENPTTLVPQIVMKSDGDSSAARSGGSFFDTLGNVVNGIASFANFASQAAPAIGRMIGGAGRAAPIVEELAEAAPLLLM